MHNILNYMFISWLEVLLLSPCFKGTLSKNWHYLPHSPLHKRVPCTSAHLFCSWIKYPNWKAMVCVPCQGISVSLTCIGANSEATSDNLSDSVRPPRAEFSARGRLARLHWDPCVSHGIMLLSIWIYEVVKSQISQLSCGISLRHTPFWS
jgi:hypothetical protein